MSGGGHLWENGMIQSSRRIELLFWASLPGIITLMLTVVFLVSKHLSGLNHFMPLLPLMPVFYWGLLHAREMPYWFVFALGMVMDAVTGMPLGLSSLLYIFFLGVVHAQRKYIHKEGFIIKWGYFATLMAVTSSLTYIILTLFNAQSSSFQPAFLQWLLTVCCYPVLHRVFDVLNEYIHSRRWSILHGH